MPRSQLGIAAISKCGDLKSHSASEIAAKIASMSVANWVEIATEIAMIRNPLSRPIALTLQPLLF